MTLSDRARRGVAWVASAEIARQVTRLVVGIFLARLLLPADFGLAAMAMFVVDFLNVFAGWGLTQAVIQREEVTADDWSSVYWVGIGFGALVVGMAWVLGPVAAVFFRDHRVIPIVRVAGWGALLGSLGVTQAAWLSKRMQFRTIAEAEWAGALAGGTVAVTMAWSGWGVWSLVVSALVGVGITAVLLHLRCPWRPELKFRASTLRWVARFGLGLQGFGVINYLHRRLDDAIIGRYIGPVGLGYYGRAYQLMLYPVSNIAGVVGRAIFPALSEIGGDLVRLRRAYLRTVSAIATVTFPAMLGLLVTAPEVIVVLFGPQWMPTVPVLQVLCLVGLMQSVVTTVGWIYMARARTDLLFAWGVGATVVIGSAFLLGLPWGIMGIAVAYAAANVLLFFPALSIPFRLIQLPITDLVRSVRGMLAGALLMAGVTAVVRASMVSRQVSALVVLGASMATGILTYAAWLWLTDSGAVREARLAWSRGVGPQGARLFKG